jgi:hypothetical protein
MSRSRELALVLLAAALARGILLWLGLTLFWDSAELSHAVQDIRTWKEFFKAAHAGFVPYVDFSKEYPVGAGMFYWALSRWVNAEDLRQTVLLHGLVMGAVDLVNTAIVYAILRRLAPERAILLSLLFSLNLTILLLSPLRFESLLTAFVLLGYWAHLRRRPMLATFLWSIGCWLKWVPALFIAAQEWKAAWSEQRRWRWVGALLVFLAVTALMNGWFLLEGWRRHGDLRFFLAPYRFHLERPLYWDTLLGVGQLWLGRLAWERYATFWTLPLVGLALVVRPSLRFEYRAVLLCVAAILFNRIYSAQFHLWFYPFLFFGLATEQAGSRFRAILAAWSALDILNVLVFPFSFAACLGEIGRFEPYAAASRGGLWSTIFSAAIVSRSLGLVALAWLLLAAPRSGRAA